MSVHLCNLRNGMLAHLLTMDSSMSPMYDKISTFLTKG
jgi:hypothetical protein